MVGASCGRGTTETNHKNCRAARWPPVEKIPCWRSRISLPLRRNFPNLWIEPWRGAWEIPIADDPSSRDDGIEITGSGVFFYETFYYYHRKLPSEYQAVVRHAFKVQRIPAEYLPAAVETSRPRHESNFRGREPLAKLPRRGAAHGGIWPTLSMFLSRRARRLCYRIWKRIRPWRNPVIFPWNSISPSLRPRSFPC